MTLPFPPIQNVVGGRLCCGWFSAALFMRSTIARFISASDNDWPKHVVSPRKMISRTTTGPAAARKGSKRRSGISCMLEVVFVDGGNE